MAACGEIPEPGRPPDAISHLRKCDAGRKKNADCATAVASAKITNANLTISPRKSPFDANYNLELFSSKETKAFLNFGTPRSPKLDLRSNCKQTLRKVFFKRQTTSALNNNTLESGTMIGKKTDNEAAMRKKTLIATVSQSVEETRTRKRYSFHQDVEEALNSLLWQPYEYQQSNRERTSASSSCYSSCSSRDDCGCCERRRVSLCSSSCSSLSSSSGLESSNNGANRSGNTADLHLLVNNLRPHALNQSERRAEAPRDPTQSKRLSSASTYLLCADSTQRSLARLASRACSHSHPHSQCAHHTTSPLASRSECDVPILGTTMRVEIQQPAIKNIIANGGNASPSALLLQRNNDNNQAQDAAAAGATAGSSCSSSSANASASIPPPPRSNRPTARNLSSVNVVGLPSNHPRQASVPASLTITPTTRSLVPNHSRNISEPYRGVNSFISTTNGNNNTPLRNNGSGANVVSLFNHQRLNGSSQPPARSGYPHGQHIAFTTSTTVGSTSELMQCPNNNNNVDTGGDVSGVAGTSVGVVRTTNNNNNNNSRVPLNVSNVNVNYYRAVPVNVVSAVPTIQCLNTSGGSGNGSTAAIAATSCTNAAANQPAAAINGLTTVTTATIGTITDSNNVSNVNIVQAMPLSTNNSNQPMAILGGGPTATTTCTEVIVHSTPTASPALAVAAKPEVVRTFTSTEAQTDDTVIPPPENTTINREQRRRERRERRHQRRLNNANHRHTPGTAEVHHQPSAGVQMPDLLNNTLPPPYNGGAGHPHHQLAHSHPPVSQQSVLQPGNIIVPPGTIVQSLVPNSLVPNGLVPNAMVPFHPQVVPGQVPLVQAAGPIPVPVPSPTGFRFPLPANGFRRSRYTDDPPKSCCGLLAWRPRSLRWFIALIALVAVCCVLVGTALGAMGPSGRDHLTVSLLMIGVGIILVTVSGVAWRLTSHDSSTCRSMLGLGSTESVEACPRRFVPRLPPSYGRPHHPYAAMMYPEFQYRPPPPSYQASMQEYRLRLLLLDRGSTPQIQAGIQNAVSPPPTYRSHSGSLLRVPLSNRRDPSQSEYSCPPSYRSQNSSSRAAAMLQTNSIMHSREQSLSLSESNYDGSVVNVVNILSTNEEDIALDNITLDSLKLEPEELNPLKMLLKGSNGELEGTKDGNLVTIVQTNDQSPVIVTVSGSSHSDNCNSVQITEISNEMEILAHL